MSKSAIASNARHQRDHSDKVCVCGGHSTKDRKRQRRKVSRITAAEWLAPQIRVCDDMRRLTADDLNKRVP